MLGLRAAKSSREIRLFVEHLEGRRLLSAGELDRTFGEEGIATAEFNSTSFDWASAVASGPDGSIYVGATVAAGGPDAFAVAKLNAFGERDPSFAGDGTVVISATAIPGHGGQLHGMVVQPDGKIVVAGILNEDFALVRIDPNGTLDPTFGSGGVVVQNMANRLGSSNPASDTLWDLQLQSDGKLLAVGSTDNGNHSLVAMARFQPNGSFDSSFGAGGRVVLDLGPMMGLGAAASSILTSAVVLPDGKIMGAGYLAPGRPVLVRFNANGSLDSGFADRGAAYDARLPYLYATAVTAIPGGGFYTTLDLTGGGLARWNANGTLDTTFGHGAGFVTLEANNARGWDGGSVVVQPDGNVLAAVDASGGWAIASFTPAGDPIFSSRQLFGSNQVNAGAVLLQPGGRAVVVGGGRTFPFAFPEGPVAARYRITPDPILGVRLEAGVIVVTGNDEDNVLNVARDVAQWTVTLDGVTTTFPAAVASRVDARLLGGNDDVTFADGAAAGGVELGDGDDVFRDGGITKRVFGGNGNDSFELHAASTAPTETRVKGDAGTDRLITIGTAAADAFRLTDVRLDGGGRLTRYESLEDLTVRAGDGDDQVLLDYPYNATFGAPRPADGPTASLQGEGGNDVFTVDRAPFQNFQSFVGGAGDDQLLVTPNVFNALAFAAGDGADLVRFTGTGATDTVSLADAAVSMSGTNLTLGDPEALEAIEVNSVGGNDTVTNQRTRAGVPTTINAGAGVDTYSAGAVALAASVGVLFNAGGDVNDAVVLADPDVNADPEAQPDAHQYLIGGGTVRRDGVTSLLHTGVDVLSFVAGNGGSRVVVADAVGLAKLTVGGGAGDDTFEITPAVPAGGLGSDAGAIVRLGGASGADTFRVTPDAAAVFQVIGGGSDSMPVTGNDPLVQNLSYDAADPGDRLEVNLAGVTSPRLNWLGRGRGRYTFATPPRLIDFAGIESLNDLPAPAATMGFAAGPPQTLTIAFAADVGASLTVNDLQLTNLTTNQAVAPADVALAYDAETRTAVFTFPNGPLKPGRYSAVLRAGSVDGGAAAGTLAVDFAIEFDPPPTVTFDPVTPDPASTPVNAITFHFSEPVTGFTRFNLRLTRDGAPADLLTAAQSLTALPDGRSYTLSNLAPLTGPAGAYQLSVVNGQFIKDSSGIFLFGSLSESWVMTQSVTATSGRFDFGTSASAVDAAYTRVTQETVHAFAGYGWTLADDLRVSRDRGSFAGATSLTRDFVETADGTFAANLVNGTYDVTVTMGDATAAHDAQAVSLEAVLRDTVNSAAGQFVTRTYTVTVSDGQLTLRLQDLGGADPVCVINALTVVATTPSIDTGRFDVTGTDRQQVVLAVGEVIDPTTLQPTDFSVLNLTTGEPVPAGRLSATLNSSRDQITLRFPGYADGVLPDGNYTVTVAAGSIAASTGIPLAFGHVTSFYSLAGDADQNRRVDAADFSVLASNYGRTGQTWATGDFDYDGAVTAADFSLLASRYGTTLNPVVPAGSPSPGTASPTAATPAAARPSRVPDRRTAPPPRPKAPVVPTGRPGIVVEAKGAR